MNKTPGRRQPQPEELFAATADLPRGPGHPFYTKLNAVLAGDRFDTFIEHPCAPSYKDGGRIGIPRGHDLTREAVRELAEQNASTHSDAEAEKGAAIEMSFDRRLHRLSHFQHF